MANFNFATLNKSFKGAPSDYSVLINSLDIKQKQLEADGKLSPGDYDLLTQMAQGLYAHPGLTAANRSQIEVKIAGYKSDKSKNTIADNSNITRLNNESQDDNSQITMRFANDPKKFLQAKSASLAAKIDQLSQSIDTLEGAGSDASSQQNELTKTMADYQNMHEALADVEGYDGKSAPKSDYAAYAVTNSKGEIVDMKIDRVGGQSGYNETNGSYGGLPLYGKLNRKDESGNKVFKIGSQTFTAPDLVTPNADGTMKPSVLFDSSAQKSAKGGFSVAGSGYTPVDLTRVRPQGAVPTGGWVKGAKGVLYQSQADGSYKKYVNYSPKDLNIADNDIIQVPSSMEAGIAKNAKITVDATKPAMLPLPDGAFAPGPTTPDFSKGMPQPDMKAAISQMQAPASTTPAPVGRPATGAPTVQAPSTLGGIASGALNAAKGFFGSIFGGGK